MKKLLVMLTMLAAISNAAVLELSVDGVTQGGADFATTLTASDYVMIDVYCSSAPDFDNFGVQIVGPASVEGLGTKYENPAPDSDLIDYSASYPDYFIQLKCTGVMTPTPAVGKWWDIELHCEGAGTVYVYLWNEDTTEIEQTLTITQIPEPMTIALLGLGGLFLRRRK